VSPSKKLRYAACVLGVILLGYLAFCGVRTTRIETIRTQAIQSLATGASFDEVAHFLDAKHFEHSELIRPEAMFAHGKSYDDNWVVIAVRRGRWRSMLQREDVQLIFVFDEGHQLERTDVFPVCTGL